jgi:glycerol-3-phosphate cytidylyltransferase
MSKEKKKIIGYTTGVYDMFHIGHLNIIKNAKKKCDYLIVGVSTDEVVKKYKNKTPIVPLEDRMEIIRALKYVDEVVVQDSMDKMKAWEKYKFDILFHGDDWANSDMYKQIEKRLNAVGAKVVFLPHTPGVSTTILTEIIKRR